MINPPPLTAMERIERLEQAVKLLLEEVADLRAEPPTPALLQRKREQRRH